ncbi:MAG: hypothetical protein JJT94_04595 [Bernardetiaceae bacterium]|nr:hypothetical protein [Bernardetiaceae bacterium]
MNTKFNREQLQISKAVSFLIFVPALTQIIFNLSQKFISDLMGYPAIFHYAIVAYTPNAQEKLLEAKLENNSPNWIILVFSLFAIYIVAYGGVLLFHKAYHKNQKILQWIGILLAFVSLKPFFTLIERIILVLSNPNRNYHTGAEFWLADFLNLNGYMFVSSLCFLSFIFIFSITRKITKYDRFILSISACVALPLGYFLGRLLGTIL